MKNYTNEDEKSGKELHINGTNMMLLRMDIGYANVEIEEKIRQVTIF